MLLSLLALGNVPYNFGEADKCPFLAENRINNNACPKATAVLTNAPTFRFVPNLLLGLFECSRRQPALLVRRRIKARNVLADNFFFSIPRNVFGSRVPTGDVPLWVKHMDCIVLHTLNYHMKMLLGCLQGAIANYQLALLTRKLSQKIKKQHAP